MNSNSEETNSVDQWTPCEPGTLTQYATARVESGAKASSMKIAGLSLAVACGLVAVIFSSSLFLPNGGDSNAELPYLGGLACTAVVDSMPDYFEGSLDEETHRKTTKHLLDCPACLAKFEKDAAARGKTVDLTLASTGFSPATQWPLQSTTHSSLAVVSWPKVLR
ncbi:MAG: hypothetical protein Aurels2KO_38450 [Aureliella sp.]